MTQSLINEVREVAARRSALRAKITGELDAVRAKREAVDPEERVLRDALTELEGETEPVPWTVQPRIGVSYTEPVVIEERDGVAALPEGTVLKAGETLDVKTEIVVDEMRSTASVRVTDVEVRKTDDVPQPPSSSSTSAPARPITRDELAAGNTMAERIRDALKKGPLIAKETALATGLQAHSVGAQLSVMKSTGRVIHDPETHKYALPGGAPMPLADAPKERPAIITPPPEPKPATTTIDAICKQAGLEPPPADHPVRAAALPVPGSKSEAKRSAVQASTHAEAAAPAQKAAQEESGAPKATANSTRAETVAPAATSQTKIEPPPAQSQGNQQPAKPPAAERASAAMTPQAHVIEMLRGRGPQTLSALVDMLVNKGQKRATAPNIVHGMFPDTIRKIAGDRYYLPRRPEDAEKIAPDLEDEDDDADEDDERESVREREPQPPREAFRTRPAPPLPKSSWVTNRPPEAEGKKAGKK